MSATLVVTNEAFELLWRSQSYCFMTPAAVENLRKCHAKFLAEKSLHGTRCRTVVRKYWRHVPLPQPPEHNHGANMCLIDLSTWPAPPPDAVEVMETDCTMYHLDKDFVLWAVHPADQPEAMVHSIRVLEIARLIQWMKPRRGPHPHPKSRSLVVVDGSDMTILATYPPGVMQDELRLGSSVFEIVGDEDRDSFAERPPTQLYLPNPKDHGKTRRKFNAVPIVLLDGFLFVIEEADDKDLSVAAAQSMVSLSTGGFQQLSALIREDAQAPGGQAQDGSDGPASSSLGLPSSPQVSQLQHSESHVSTPAQHLPPPPPPPALHPQWSSHPPTPTVPMPALAAKKAPSSNIPSWQLPPLPKYRDSYYAANNHNHAGVPTPGTLTHSTWSSAHAHSAPAAASDRVQHPLPRIHPPRLVVPFAPPMQSNPSAAVAAAAAAAGSMYESPRSMTFDARSRSAKDGSVGFTSPMYGRDYGPHAAHAAIYPPLLSPMSTASSGPHGSAYPSRSSTASGVAGASEQSWYAQQHQQQQQYPDAPRGSTSYPRYRTFDIVADAATDRAIHPPSSSHHRSASYHQQRPTPQFVPAHDALGEVYFEPPVFPAPQNYPSSYIHGHPPQPHPYPPHARHMPSFSSAPYARPGPPPRPDDILPHLAGPYHDERYGLQECYPSAPPPPHPQHPPVPSPGSYSSKQHGYPPHQHPQYAHHPSATDVYPPSRDAYSPQTAQCATGRHAAWATPQYASVPGADPYAHPFGYHGLPPPPPLPTLMAPVPRAKAEPSAAGGMYPLEPSAEAEAETADVYGTGAPQFGNGYGYALKSSAEQPHLAHPRHQEWQAQGHHQAMYKPVAQEDHEPMGSQLDDDAQHLPRQGDAHIFGQAIASTRGQGSGGADDAAEDGLDEDDDEDAPILDLGHTHTTRAPSSAAATGPRSKRSNSSRGGQRLSTSKRKRGISPQLTPAANALANANANPVHGDDSAVGGLSSKFVAGYVNPRYPMRPSPHGVPCARCGMLESPEWRRGEAGIRDLCNACGLKYYREKKQREKVARRAAAGPSSSSVPLVAAADVHGPSSSVTLRGHPE